MKLLKKNYDYTLRHVDSDTGFGLLYTQKHDKCTFLNPLAVILWNTPTDFIDISRESLLFAEHIKVDGAAEYLKKVVLDMYEGGILLAANEEAQVKESASPEKSYGLGQIYFYATRECNAHCYHCYQPTKRVQSSPQPLQNNQLSQEVFLRFIERALPLGLRHVKITGGEPLLRTDLGDIIRGIRRLAINVSIETNGFLIDDAMVNMLAEQDVDVSISLDGGSAAVHDTLRQLPGSFERVAGALRRLADRGLDPKVIMSISRRNFGEIENVLRVAASNGCRLVKLNPVNTLGLAKRLEKSQILLTVQDIMALYKRRAELESKYGVFVFLEGPPAFSSTYEIVSGHAAICPFTSILGVLADGSLSFCGIGNSCPELIFGTITDEGFDIQKAWHKIDLLVQVRQLLSRKLEGVCARCLLEPYCKGSCRALAYGELGNFLAPHPWCQSAFEEGIFPVHYLK